MTSPGTEGKSDQLDSIPIPTNDTRRTILPRLVVERIVGLSASDRKSILALRRTCTGFRYYIDDVKPELVMTEIDVTLLEETIIMFLKSKNGATHIVYKKKISEDADFFNSFFDAFESILKLQFVLERMAIRVDVKATKKKTRVQFVETMRKTLEAGEAPNVKQVEINGSEELARLMMPCFNAQHLKIVKLLQLHQRREETPMTNLENWKSGEELISDKETQELPLEYVLRFQKFYTVLETSIMDKLKKIKEELLNRPSTFKTTVIRLHGLESLGEVHELGTPYKMARDHVEFYFRNPNAADRVLFMYITMQVVKIVNAPLSSAPNDAFDAPNNAAISPQLYYHTSPYSRFF